MSRRDRLVAAVGHLRAAVSELRGRGVVAAAVGGVSDRPPVPGGVQAPPAPRWSWPRNVSTTSVAPGLTPAKIASYLREADAGNPAAFAQLCLEVLDRDPHITSVLGTRYRAVANLPWKLEPASSSPLDRRIAEELTTDLKALSTLRAGMIDLLASIFVGWSAVEIEWMMQGGRVRPARLHHRPAHWLRPDPADPELWRVLDSADAFDGVPLEPNRWILHHARAKAGYPVQAGLGRTTLWWYLFRTYAVKDWVSYNEKWGSPLRVGKYPSTAEGDDVDALEEALQRLGVDAYAMIPDDMDVSFVADAGGKTGADTHERLYERGGREISKLILGQTLTTEEGPKGAQALGVVHNDVRADLRDGDATELAGTLQRDLIGPMVAFNYGAHFPLPTWVFDSSPAPDRQADATVQEARGRVFAAARALGVPVPVAQVREELGIREPEAGEAVLPPEAPAAPPPALGLAGRALSGALPADSEAPGRQACHVAGRRLSIVCAASGAPGEARAVIQYERVLRRYRDAIAGAWARIIAELRRELGDRTTAAEVEAALPGVLQRLGIAAYADELAAATLEAEVLGIQQVQAGDSGEIPRPTGSPLGDGDSWRTTAGDTPEAWATRVARHRARAEAAVQATILRTARDILAGLAQGRPVDDSLDVARQAPQRTDAVLDGAATGAWGQGRWEAVVKAPPERRLYIRYHTVDDDKVRPAHRVMHHRVYPATHAIWKVWTPPNGYGCRCWITVHTEEEVRQAGWTISEDYPSLATKSGDTAPAVPDAGWQKHHGASDYKWADYPESWRAALKVREPRTETAP